MSDWFVRPSSDSETDVQLFCFPYAGAGASVYARWAGHLPAGISLCAVQLPGRERRYREAPITSLLRIVDQATEEIVPFLSTDFVFFGHSMGALLAFEVCRALRRRELPVPLVLFVSGRMPPRQSYRLGPLHLLPDDQFVREIRARYGGFPDAVARDPELLELFLPTLRADVVAHETYSYEPDEVLDLPIVGLAGRDDRTVSPSQMAGWVEETTCFGGVETFVGGHFFIQSEQNAVLRFMVDHIAGLRRSSQAKRVEGGPSAADADTPSCGALR